MVEAIVENEVCEKCGADVREGTAFCYNCGSSLVEEPIVVPDLESNDKESVDEKTKAALEDLAERLKREEENDDKLAKAAAERKKARVSSRKPKSATWEQSDDPGGFLVIAALAIAVLAGVVVFLTVFWK